MVGIPRFIHIGNHLFGVPGIHTQFVDTVDNAILIGGIDKDTQMIVKVLQDAVGTASHNHASFPFRDFPDNFGFHLEQLILRFGGSQTQRELHKGKIGCGFFNAACLVQREPLLFRGHFHNVPVIEIHFQLFRKQLGNRATQTAELPGNGYTKLFHCRLPLHLP